MTSEDIYLSRLSEETATWFRLHELLGYGIAKDESQV